MNIELIASSERGVTETPWLYSQHSFSFGNYYNLKRLNFGTLRVLNEDVVQPGKGFGTHEHDNMEIVTIVLKGALEHKDSMGNHGVIQAGQVQRMSAGKGITHSEFNASTTEKVHFLQIWVFPKVHDLQPSYEQRSFQGEELHNRLCPIVTSMPNERSLSIHQDAQFYLGKFDAGKEGKYPVSSKKRGVYFFVISGEVTVGDKRLKPGDAAQLTQLEEVQFKALAKSEILLIDVALQILN